MDKSKLLAPRHDTGSGMPEDTVEIPGFGTARVRGLSRLEALEANAAEEIGGFERVLLVRGMLDPDLTEAEAIQWQTVAPAREVRLATDKIVELSGLGVQSAKEAYKSPGDEPGAGE